MVQFGTIRGVETLTNIGRNSANRNAPDEGRSRPVSPLRLFRGGVGSCRGAPEWSMEHSIALSGGRGSEFKLHKQP